MRCEYYVYKWTHVESGRAYIGKGKGSRAWHHLRKSRGVCKYFHAAPDKHGVDAFRLAFLAGGLSAELASELERAAISAYGTFGPDGYNLTLGGEGAAGRKYSEETLRKMSEVHLGRKPTEETRARMSRSKKGRPWPKSPESVAKVANAKRGKPNAKIAAALSPSGVALSEAHEINILLLLRLGARARDVGRWFGRGQSAILRLRKRLDGRRQIEAA